MSLYLSHACMLVLVSIVPVAGIRINIVNSMDTYQSTSLYVDTNISIRMTRYEMGAFLLMSDLCLILHFYIFYLTLMSLSCRWCE
jgi:hypothetical protein